MKSTSYCRISGNRFSYARRDGRTHTPKVSTEMSLHVLAYNLKRMMNIFGILGLLEAIRA
ncbi:hypothetical protein GUY40_25500 [Pseudomonas sp. R5(2019)]|nr:hypothetical protein [Pseudomonas sp. R5(2019)]